MLQYGTSVPKVSVIIPIYNTEEVLLKKSIDSILSQTFTGFELILVDDCCTDNSPEICEDYATKDRRIKVVHNNENKGCPQSRKIGLEQAKGEYILFSDSDNRLENNMLEYLYNAATTDNLDMVYCDYFKHHPDSSIEHIKQGEFVDQLTSIKDIIGWKLWGVVWDKMVRKSVYEKVTFPTNFMHEDEVITIQAFYYAGRISYIAKPLYHYLYHDLFITDKYVPQAYDNYKQIMVFLLEKYPHQISFFEPELSNRINLYKYWLVRDKCPRKILFDLYPESHKHIFRTHYLRIPSRIQLFCKVNRIPFYPVELCLKVILFFRRLFYKS